MAFFELTDRHLKTGALTADDYARQVGFQVGRANLAEFPHWQKLNNTGLTPSELTERSAAITKQLQNVNVSYAFTSADPFERDDDPYDTTEDRLATARMKEPHVKVNFMQSRLSGDVTSHFRRMFEVGVDAVVNPQDMPGAKLHLVGVMSEELPPTFQNTYKAHGAFVFLCSEPARDYWAHFTGIVPENLTKIPTDGAHNLADELHELGHLMQVSLGYNKLLVHFYAETDCDLFARSVLRQRPEETRETREAWMHARHTGYLLGFKQAHHWIAPHRRGHRERKKTCGFL